MKNTKTTFLSATPKRALALLLSIALLALLMPALPAAAVYYNLGEWQIYHDDNYRNEVHITGYYGNERDVVVPSSFSFINSFGDYLTLPVTHIGYGNSSSDVVYFQNTPTSITLPGTVIGFSRYAFYSNPWGTGFPNLRDLYITSTSRPAAYNETFLGVPSNTAVNVHVPYGTASQYTTASNGRWFPFIVVEAAGTPVTGITNVPTAATAGVPLYLSGTIAPANTPNRNISWSVISGGTTRASIDQSSNTLLCAAAGTVTVRATITGGGANGANYSQDFRITVTGIVPVTDITQVPTTATAGTPLTLVGNVLPADASNRTIVWRLVNAGSTGATLNGYMLNTLYPGVVSMQAVVENGTAVGTDYVLNFSVTVTGGSGTPITPGAPDPWANAEVTAALNAGLLPSSVSTGGWSATTSRLSAADAIVRLIEQTAGRTMAQIAYEFGWDLNTDHFYDCNSQAVNFLKKAGITRGVGNNMYNPSAGYTRAQFVTMIGRTAETFFGRSAQGYNPFYDVPDWAAPYVGYAAQNGITQGVGGNRFDSDGILQNQQTAAFIYRTYNVWH